MTLNDLNNVRALILDMDGVLWRGPLVLGDLPAIFADLHRLQLKVILATNNATRSIQQYLEKLDGLGVPLEPWQVINSAEATGAYLRKQFPQGGPVYVVGEIGLVETLEKYGFEIGEKEPLAVVAAMDRSLTYEKLRKATLLIRAGVPFIGTNPDRSFPTPEGEIPGAGSILAAIEAATDVEPLVIGKPKPGMYEVSLERLKTSPQETLVVGDRLETDIAGGQAIGALTALVLSGVTNQAEAAAWSPAPDLILPDLTGLVELLKDGRKTVNL